MSIVRSLLIKIGFQTDKSSVNQANRTVDRFKSKFALIAASATYAATKVVGFFNSIANSLLDADDLSKALGISLEQLIAIQKAASNFRIDETQISGALNTLNELLIGFRTKTNLELAEIARARKFEITEEDNSLSILQKVLVGLSNIKDEQERIRVAGNIFGKEIAPKISNLSVQIEKFNEANKNFLDNSTDLQKTVDVFKKYDELVRSLNEAWKSFVIDIAPDVVQSLNHILESIKQNFQWMKVLYNFQSGFFKFAKNPFTDQKDLKAAISQGSKLLDPYFDRFKNNTSFLTEKAKEKIMQASTAVNAYIGNKDDLNNMNNQFRSNNIPNVTVNNEINVPTGTPQEQTQMITEAITKSFRSAIENSWREIQYNNPQVE